jgi:hypothetical protein
MDYKTNTNDLMNYEHQSSNSTNYSSFQTTSSPESFPKIMENGILIKYESMNFSSELIEETDSSEE